MSSPLTEPQATSDELSLAPNTFAAICEWAYVARDMEAQDWTRSYCVLYREPEVAWAVENDMLYPVTVRVQGFVDKFNLSPLGCWDG